jgi:hypothetical protein
LVYPKNKYQKPDGNLKSDVCSKSEAKLQLLCLVDLPVHSVLVGLEAVQVGQEDGTGGEEGAEELAGPGGEHLRQADASLEERAERDGRIDGRSAHLAAHDDADAGGEPERQADAQTAAQHRVVGRVELVLSDGAQPATHQHERGQQLGQEHSCVNVLDVHVLAIVVLYVSVGKTIKKTVNKTN